VSDALTFALALEQHERFVFDVTFDDPSWPALRMDEPPPLGDGIAPNASRALGAAIGNCLAASLLFCLQKARVPVTGLRAEVRGELGRNEKGRLRIASVRVVLRPSVEGVPAERLARCLELFEDFCVVTQSVREGIDVQVLVEPQGVAEGG
jgi:organic hydroperoxide reductase OsmC/OhrA